VLFHFASVLVFLLVACGFLAVTLLVGKILRPTTPNREKGLGYECGEQPMGSGWFNFNPRFYVVALVFLIFDVEIVFTYPVATVFRDWVATGEGGTAFVEIAAFIAVLALGLGYVWRRGDLSWVRDDASATPVAVTSDPPAPPARS
jgi:NADH-quinone oxidoreductase subunit A